MDKFITQNGQWATVPSGGGGGGGSSYVLGGNSFGQVAALGLLDGFALHLIVNGSTFVVIDPVTGVAVPGDLAVGADVVAAGKVQAGSFLGGELLLVGTVDPGPGLATARVRAFPAQTGDLLRLEDNAGTALVTVDSAGDVVVAGSFQVGPVPPVGPFGDLRVSQTFVGDAALKLGLLSQLVQTSGTDTGSILGAFVSCSSLGNSSNTGPFTIEAVATHGGTGALTGTMAVYVAFYGANPDAPPATAIGAIGTAQAFDAEADMSAGASSSAVALVDFRSRAVFGADATHTVQTKYGTLYNNQGATGITNGIAIQIDAQTGASGANLGIKNAAPLEQDNYLDVGPIVAPGNPAAGYWRIYSDTADGTLKARNSAGTVRNIALP